MSLVNSSLRLRLLSEFLGPVDASPWLRFILWKTGL